MSETPSISDDLTSDHERIDACFRDLVDALGETPEAARRSLDELDRGLRRHMTWEEMVLFPAVLQAAPVTYRRRAVDSLCSDHDCIRTTLTVLRAEILSGRREAAVRSLETLRVLLAGHNRDEEIGVYGDADRLLPADERRRILDLFAVDARSASPVEGT